MENAGVTLICGGLCCGKTTYARALSERTGAVTLSVDEVMLSVFGQDAGERHDEYAAGVKKYLLGLAVRLARSGVGVILDWGFWTAAERRQTREFFGARGISCELHYIDIDDETWRRRVAERNAAVKAGAANAYFVDEGLTAKFLRRFEAPQDGEVDVFVR